MRPPGLADNFEALALGNLGLIYAQRQDYDRARSMLQAVLVLSPDDQRARMVLEQVEQLARSRTPKPRRSGPTR